MPSWFEMRFENWDIVEIIHTKWTGEVHYSQTCIQFSLPKLFARQVLGIYEISNEPSQNDDTLSP